ncbi:hypothetical protein E2C01_042079 [Portunus trituberculatus]|uniref:Uncharacterized protein n=1 Tax=Portunus trituberculatus TaxID=210409 RepID=A0A5B7FLK3_PORTR|nr:hypothetical protein [Portunus trituberculatus]
MKKTCETTLFLDDPCDHHHHHHHHHHRHCSTQGTLSTVTRGPSLPHDRPDPVLYPLQAALSQSSASPHLPRAAGGPRVSPRSIINLLAPLSYYRADRVGHGSHLAALRCAK